jgi:hypothetical protein
VPLSTAGARNCRPREEEPGAREGGGKSRSNMVLRTVFSAVAPSRGCFADPGASRVSPGAAGDKRTRQPLA